MTKNIIITAIIALVVSLGVGFFNIGSQQSNVDVLGGVSERDIKAVSLKVGSPTSKFNVNSAGTLVGVGTTTPRTNGNIVVDSTATTTLILESSASTKGGCIQMETVTGGTVAITVTGTTISAAATTCR
jgi:hypothetical protein